MPVATGLDGRRLPPPHGAALQTTIDVSSSAISLRTFAVHEGRWWEAELPSR